MAERRLQMREEIVKKENEEEEGQVAKPKFDLVWHSEANIAEAAH